MTLATRLMASTRRFRPHLGECLGRFGQNSKSEFGKRGFTALTVNADSVKQ